jgi:hypothetical protein
MVSRLEKLVGHEVRVHSPPLGVATADEDILRDIDQRRRAVRERHRSDGHRPAAFATHQRRQDRDGGVLAGDDVDQLTPVHGRPHHSPVMAIQPDSPAPRNRSLAAGWSTGSQDGTPYESFIRRQFSDLSIRNEPVDRQ